ncbi:hypothetical protein [Pedobacter sp. N23S346]|uniref:hypothetical protein n=1 Tax=Pedobacter sp. N23S346 TaxID=3402750 RepID=UPI003ABFEA14
MYKSVAIINKANYWLRTNGEHKAENSKNKIESNTKPKISGGKRHLLPILVKRNK